MRRTLSLRTVITVVISAVVAIVPSVLAQEGIHDGQWPNFGADAANTKYSSLDQIDEQNFADLQVAWTWEPTSQLAIAKSNPRIRLGQFKPTPIMIDGALYLATNLSQVVAIDAGTGKTKWEYDPKSYEAGRPANVGFQHRGVAYWTDGQDNRIFVSTHDRKLIALDAETGDPCLGFGNDGVVDLAHSLGRKIDHHQITHSSPPGICGDTVVVGSIVSDGAANKEAPPGHVRGYDARDGRMKWIFHTIPSEGEFGNDTWEDESWRYTGACNVWSMFACDPELGYVYLPTSTPTNDMYGGHRPGDNLFAECLVCVDADTGKRVWHFQAVHHGLWDYDFPTAPNLVDVVVDGRPIKAVAQVSKQAFCYVFDRETGEPVWPIEERPVPSGALPGDRASPTQPFPTKPAAYDNQGFTVDQLIDFTPELRATAVELVSDYRIGPLFTPPCERGTLGTPGAGGGTNWHGAALDSETGVLYVPSYSGTGVFKVGRPDPARSNLRYITSWFSAGPDRSAIGNLPLTKPPYSRVTAIDLNTGEHVWMTPHGDGPRDHPAIRHLNLPPLGEVTGAGAPLLTKSLLFVSQGHSRLPGGTSGPKLSVFDKKTGAILGSIPLPDSPHGNPITYMHDGKQYIAIAVGGGRFMGGGGTPGKLIALSLP